MLCLTLLFRPPVKSGQTTVQPPSRPYVPTLHGCLLCEQDISDLAQSYLSLVIFCAPSIIDFSLVPRNCQCTQADSIFRLPQSRRCVKRTAKRHPNSSLDELYVHFFAFKYSCGHCTMLSLCTPTYCGSMYRFPVSLTNSDSPASAYFEGKPSRNIGVSPAFYTPVSPTSVPRIHHPQE